jgi:hypothetical protein
MSNPTYISINVSAAFWATDGGGVDVTAQVKTLVADGATTIPASNQQGHGLSFPDPQPGHTKDLLISWTNTAGADCTIEGSTGSFVHVVQEGRSINLTNAAT